jgi:hypothetical protein
MTAGISNLYKQVEVECTLIEWMPVAEAEVIKTNWAVCRLLMGYNSLTCALFVTPIHPLDLI